MLFRSAILIFTKRGIVENYTNVFDEYARLSAMSYREAKVAMDQFSAKIERGEGLNYLTRIAVPNMNRARWAYEAKIAQGEILRAQLALKVYQARNGGPLPASLNELVNTGILSRVPTDSFSAGASEALRYDVQTGKVWSVGSNGLDQLGKGDDELKSP